MKQIICLISLLVISDSFAEINFFSKEIDYWNEKNIKKNISKATPTSNSKKEKKEFDWEKYKDIENDEFFKEGNHIPPAPFMEVARRPTKKNIENWLEYINQKNAVQRRFLKEIRKYQASKELSPESKSFLVNQEKLLNFTPDDFKGVTVTTYFLTTCPACKKMFQSLSELQKNEIYVEAIQVDYKKKLKSAVDVPVYLASDKEAKGLIEAGIGVPYSILRIGKKAFPLNGYQNSQGVISMIIREKQKRGRNK